MDIKYGKLSKICQKCGSAFAGSIYVNGKPRSTGDRIYCFTCSPFGNRNKRHLSKYKQVDGLECRKCSHCNEFKPLLTAYHKNYVSGPCIECTHIRDRNRSQSLKLTAIKYKGGKCHDCQQIFHPGIFDFHHLDPNQKDFEIGNRKMLRLEPELDKCVLLCANCHRSRHYDSTNPNYCPVTKRHSS